MLQEFAPTDKYVDNYKWSQIQGNDYDRCGFYLTTGLFPALFLIYNHFMSFLFVAIMYDHINDSDHLWPVIRLCKWTVIKYTTDNELNPLSLQKSDECGNRDKFKKWYPEGYIGLRVAVIEC